MPKKNGKTPRIIPTEKQKVTWGAVCQNVGFRDNLYKVCREKVPAFTGLGLDRYDREEEEDFEEDFGKLLRSSAKDIPPPPAKDWKYEPEGVMEGLLYGNKGKMLLYGGLAALAYWFIVRPKLAAMMPAAAPAQPPAQKPVIVSAGTTAKAA